MSDAAPVLERIDRLTDAIERLASAIHAITAHTIEQPGGAHGPQ